MNLAAFLKASWEHSRNSRRSRAEIEALQRKKFRRLVAHVNENSPYYRDLIAELGIDIARCVPSDFPPLTKPELMANFDRIIVDPRVTAANVEEFLFRSHDPKDLFLEEYVVVLTSGTSGTVGYFLYSPAEWARAMALGTRTFPFSLRRQRFSFYGLLEGHYLGAATVSETRRMGRLRFVSRPLDINDPLAQTIEKLNKFQPHILSGYLTAIKDLAHAQEAGTLRISPALLSLVGEPLTPEDRAFFDRVFKAPISNYYGATEHSTLGSGLTEDGGIYLFEDEFIFEIEENRTLITNLFRYTQPLIRYAMDDRLEPIDDPNPRLPFTKIQDIQGRTRRSPTFTDRHGKDDSIGYWLFVEFFVPNAERIELRVFDKLSCVLRVKLRASLTEGERTEALTRVERWLTDIFEEKEMGNVSRKIEEVKQFGGWKPRLIILPDMVDFPPTF